MAIYYLPLDIGSGEIPSTPVFKEYYKHIEVDYRGGYYPFTINEMWHGGVHIRMPQGSLIKAMADGTIIAAGLAEEEDANNHYGSSNFILMKHQLDGESYFALYMHLHWERLIPQNGTLQKIPWLKNGESEEEEMDQDLLSKLKTGKVCKLEKEVKAGEHLWSVGNFGSSGHRASLLHWGIFSETLLTGEWKTQEDPDANLNCDNQHILNLLNEVVDSDGDKQIILDELDQFFQNDEQCKRLRYYACKFISEYGVDYDKAIPDLKHRFSTIGLAGRMKPYLFWQEAVNAGVPIPTSPHVWHYHPVAFLEQVVLGSATAEEALREVDFIFPTTAEHKQYVNLTDNDGDEGMNLKIKVKVMHAADGNPLYWKVTAHEENSKRTEPAVGIKRSDTEELIRPQEGVATHTTRINSGEAELTLCCGLAGGDKFTIEVGFEEGTWLKSVEVTNWRKLWYQLTYREGVTPPSMETAIENLKNEFIEYIEESKVTHTNRIAGDVIIGNHNVETYHNMLETEHPGQCCHIILCDSQYDGLFNDGTIHTRTVTDVMTVRTAPLQLGTYEYPPVSLFDPPLQEGASFLQSGEWKNLTTDATGTFTDNPEAVTDTVGLIEYHNAHYIVITLPADSGVSSTNQVEIKLSVTSASGPWGGDGGTAPHNLIVINTDNTIHTQCVMHELGHLINMVPGVNGYGSPPGLSHSDHSHQYTGMGGAGSHCSYQYNTVLSSRTKYADGKCIMFHALNPNCMAIYCPDCSKFVKAQGLQVFGVL